MRTFKEDYKNGILNEQSLKEMLEFKFCDKLVKTDRYCIIDFEGERCWIEIKGRTNSYDRYPTTLISKRKVDFAKKQTKDVYFVFAFTDGVYYLKYTPEVFDTFRYDYFMRPARIDKRDSEEMYCYIPITSLSCI